MRVPCATLLFFFAFCVPVAGQDDVTRLVSELISGESAAVRARAAEALGRLGERAEPAADSLLLALDDRSDWVRRAALEALAEIAPTRADVVQRVLVAIRRDPSPRVRRAAEAVLDRIGPGDAEAVTLLEAALRDEDPTVARRSLGRLLELGVGPSLADLLENDDLALRLTALRHLADEGVAAREHVPRLLPFLEDDAEILRRVAIEALESIGLGSFARDERILRALDSRHEHVRHYALRVSWKSGHDAEEVLERLLDELDSGDPGSMVFAAEQLTALGSGALGAVPRLVALLEHGMREVRDAGVDALYGIGRRHAPEATAPVPFADDAALRERAVEGLVRTFHGHRAWKAGWLLAGLVPHPSIPIEPLVGGIDRHARGNGGFALALERSGERSVPELARSLNAPDPRLQRDVLEILGRMGTRASAATDAIAAVLFPRNALEKPDPSVAVRAAAAYLAVAGPIAEPDLERRSRRTLASALAGGEPTDRAVAFAALWGTPGSERPNASGLPELLEHPPARRILLAALEPREVPLLGLAPSLAAVLREGSPPARVAVLRFLARRGTTGGQGTIDTRFEAAGDLAPVFREAWLSCLASDDGLVRGTALEVAEPDPARDAEAIARSLLLDRRGVTAVAGSAPRPSLLARRISDPTATNAERMRACRDAAAGDGPEPETVAALLSLLAEAPREDPNADALSLAVPAGAARFDHLPAVLAVLESAEMSRTVRPHRDLRVHAVYALGRIADPGEAVIDALLRALDDPDRRVRSAAIHALGRSAMIERVAGALAEVLASVDESLADRTRAALGLALRGKDVGQRGEALDPLVKKLLQTAERVCGGAGTGN